MILSRTTLALAYVLCYLYIVWSISEQLSKRAKYFKSSENSKFIIQEILNYILTSRKF